MQFRRTLSGALGTLAAASLVLSACSSEGSAPKPPPPAAPAVLAVTPNGQAPANPVTPISVTATDGTITNVKVSPTSDSPDVKGALAPDKHSWATTDPLEYGTTYNITADAVNADNKPVESTFTVTTISPRKTAYANVVPAPNLVAATGIGVGQPMVFQFTEPVTNKAEVQKHLKVTTDPPQPGAWYWVSDTNVDYRGPNYWQPGTKIHIEADVFGVDLGNGIYGHENNVADYHVHDSWVAKANGSTELLTVFHNGAQVNQMPMSLGSPGHPSHEGTHVISDKRPSIVMDSCTYGVCAGQAGYYRETVLLDLRLSNDGEFVHSAPWSVGQQGSSNVSHGCVNLSPANAQWMFDHFGIGDVVEITNSGGPALPVWDTYGDWAVPWQTWEKGNATA